MNLFILILTILSWSVDRTDFNEFWMDDRGTAYKLTGSSDVHIIPYNLSSFIINSRIIAKP